MSDTAALEKTARALAVSGLQNRGGGGFGCSGVEGSTQSQVLCVWCARPWGCCESSACIHTYCCESSACIHTYCCESSACIHTYTHMHVYTYPHMHTRAHGRTHVHACTRVVCWCVQPLGCCESSLLWVICEHTHIHTYTHSWSHTCARTRWTQARAHAVCAARAAMRLLCVAREHTHMNAHMHTCVHAQRCAYNTLIISALRMWSAALLELCVSGFTIE